MGVHNVAAVVGQALDSIKAQTYRDWEFVICDDGSTDSTWEVTNRYAQSDHRFRLIRHERNRGLGHALNSCIEQSKGEYLARQDADDNSLPARFQQQVAFLDQRPEVAVLGTHMAFVGDEGRVWGALRHPEVPDKLDWLKGSRVAHPSVMMRRQTVLDVGGYDGTAIRVEDYDLWFRMLTNGCVIVNLPEILYHFHLDRKDYARQKFSHRLREMALRFRACRRLGAPVPYYLYVLKPLAAGLVPKGLLFRYHAQKFMFRKAGQFPQ